ncbi:amino acid/amide ABC transporter substrate-binding protein, HAAT family [Roseovarius pacificus]|uniref:Amino acid/amide ABC transporter substrate-binding protein, HAAT family n=1 Tax=Roseovarius pacificus TaxID=337701 RepID=A0A1M6Y982_9RHOB|nr:ABC transporter substrate-binding protein [Roseovarius pacificus]GGO51174.1 ABC transporter permease [Roseovarius pacificus]SHL14723.1 amino acid/amide ABC transporter substrate-binding protein, HAAT family [Roseovarius pacificus]
MKLLTGVTATIALSTGIAMAQDVSGDAVKIGAMVDMTGVYSANGGMGAVLGAEMAIEDFGGEVNGKPIELLSANYQNRVDVASNLAREWVDQEGVDMIIESTDSAAAIAIQNIGKEKDILTVAAGSASTALTNNECSPTGIHYVYDTFALATGTGNAIVKNGLTDWFFITADYAFGHSLEENTATVVKELGGNVINTVRHPFKATDYSSFILQAQSSGAQVVAFANAGTDFSTALKQASEFGVVQGGQTIAGMLVFLTDIYALGLDVAQGLTYTTGFYWDYNDETRAFAERFKERHGSMPTMIHAGFYSAVTHYLKGVEATGSDDPATVRAWMGENPINDFFAKDGYIREDGRMMHTMYLAQVKSPEESEGEDDVAKVLREIPAEEAYMPLAKSTCSLVNG